MKNSTDGVAHNKSYLSGLRNCTGPTTYKGYLSPTEDSFVESLKLKGWTSEEDKKEKLLNHPGIPYYFSRQTRLDNYAKDELFKLDLGTCPFYGTGMAGHEIGTRVNVASWQDCGNLMFCY